MGVAGVPNRGQLLHLRSDALTDADSAHSPRPTPFDPRSCGFVRRRRSRDRPEIGGTRPDQLAPHEGLHLDGALGRTPPGFARTGEIRRPGSVGDTDLRRAAIPAHAGAAWRAALAGRAAQGARETR